MRQLYRAPDTVAAMSSNLADSILHAARRADQISRTALRFGDRTVSYGALADDVDRFGGALQRLGLRPGDRMVLVGADSPELVAAFLGGMRVGVVGIPASTRISADDLALVLVESEARVLVCDASVRPTCASALAIADTGCRLLSTNDPAGLATRARSGTLVAPALADDAEAFWVCSSGSTGRPKGIAHRHQSLPDVCLAYHRDVLKLVPGDVVLCTSKLPFAYTIGNGLFAPLALGLTIVLDAAWPTVERTLDLIARHRPRVVFSTPTHFGGLLELREDPRWEAVQGVEHVVSAGERLPPSLLAGWRAATGRPIRDAYGCSETVFLALAAEPDSSPGSVGGPLPGVGVRLVPRPGDDSGILATGYGPRVQEAKRRFVDGWFRTGDLFEVDAAGCWHHRGREDERIKVAGQWVGIPEIEAVLGSHPAVAAGIAVAARDDKGRDRVAFCLIPTAGLDPEEAVNQVMEAAVTLLPRVKRPRWVRALEAFPRTTTGKVQRRGLRALIEAESQPPD